MKIIICIYFITEDLTNKSLAIFGTIYTLDDRNPVAEALLVQDGRIAFVGKKKLLLEMISIPIKTIQLEAQNILLPGFIDSHIHP